jgi:hypothetical protein
LAPLEDGLSPADRQVATEGFVPCKTRPTGVLCRRSFYRSTLRQGDRLGHLPKAGTQESRFDLDLEPLLAAPHLDLGGLGFHAVGFAGGKEPEDSRALLAAVTEQEVSLLQRQTLGGASEYASIRNHYQKRYFSVSADGGLLGQGVPTYN